MATLFTSTLGTDALHAWGWRIPFLLGAPLGLVGLIIRLKLDETPSFAALRQKLAATENTPMRTGSKREWRTSICGFALTILSSISVLHFLCSCPCIWS